MNKLLVTDFDGTLKFGEDVMEEDLQALRKWKEDGNVFAIATSRSRDSILPELEAFGIPADYLITANGALIYDDQGNVLKSSRLDTVTAVDLMYAARHLDDVISYAAIRDNKRFKVTVDPNVSDPVYGHLEDNSHEDELAGHVGFNQLVFSVRDESRAVELADRINLHFGSYVKAYPNLLAVFIVPLESSKATGMEYVAAYAGIDEEDTLAMGSSINDISMLSWAEHSAALPTAPWEVLTNIDRTYPSVSAFIEAMEETF